MSNHEEEVKKFVADVSGDIESKPGEVSGVVTMLVWKDGSITTGWTGAFDLEAAAGRMFNMACDFSMHAKRMREVN